MLPKELNDILNVLGKMKEYELIMAEFYRACGEVWAVDKEFWKEMEESERRHAHHIEELKGLLSEKPEVFEIGHPFKLAAIQTAIRGIQLDIEKLKAGGLTLYQTFFKARDIEQSTLEKKYTDVIRAKEREFQNLIERIVSETIDHRNKLDKKIQEWSR